MLGQRVGDPAFSRVGQSVVCELRGSAALTLAGALERMGGRWPSERRRRAREAAGAVRGSRLVAPGLMLHALCDLAEDRLEMSRLGGTGARAAQVAAQELAVACVQVAALGELGGDAFSYGDGRRHGGRTGRRWRRRWRRRR